jgi:hypothetical protein
MEKEVREKFLSLASKISGGIPIFKPHKDMARPDLTEFYERGMLKKEQLVHGKYYLGSCRNASVARWHEGNNCFRHVRHKFGDAFEEDIFHPADDDGFDVFVPVTEIEEMTESEKVTQTF